jgi:hypothetical protein
MSDKATPPPANFPDEAKRRGGMDTLFSAPWFDENAPAEEVAVPEEPPKRSNTTMLVVAAVVVLVVLPSLSCGALGVLGGVYYYVTGGGS